MEVALSLILAYLLGAIPFGYLFSRLRGVDIRKVGDRNVGSFNVFRHAGLIMGIATLVGDIGKGALAVVVAKAVCGEELVVFVAGGVAAAGHIWPVFLRFRGGRGAAVVIGVLLVLLPKEMLIAAGLAVMVLVITRNSIWASATLFVPPPLLCWLFGEPVNLLVYSMVLPCLAGLAHWVTTRRLPPEAQEEAKVFRIASEPSGEQQDTDQSG